MIAKNVGIPAHWLLTLHVHFLHVVVCRICWSLLLVVVAVISCHHHLLSFSFFIAKLICRCKGSCCLSSSLVVVVVHCCPLFFVICGHPQSTMNHDLASSTPLSSANDKNMHCKLCCIVVFILLSSLLK